MSVANVVHSRVNRSAVGRPEGPPNSLVSSTLKAADAGESFLSLFAVKDEKPSTDYWVVRTRYFGGDAYELIAYRGDQTPKRRPIDQRERPPRFVDPTTPVDPDVLKRSGARARRLIRHRVMMIGADRLLTLTYRENKEDLRECWKDFQRFRKRMERAFPQFAYVVVPERQQRGAIHFHLAVKGFYNVNVVRYHWHAAIKDVGRIDITSPRSGSDWTRVKLARYLAKYIGKDLTITERNQRRFASSKGILECLAERELIVPADSDAFYFIGRIFEVLTRTSWKRRFESDGPRPIIWLSSA